MTATDLKHMRKAIELARTCEPVDPDRNPPVGAVFAIGEVVVGQGRRGTGKLGDDEHAEHNALETIADRSQLRQATVYTTLEPCTQGVRSRPHLCCTELIRQHEVKKVFIGCLDPNQGVCGKGVLELQKHTIEVELFPPDLAQEIRILMARFNAAQQLLGVRIINPPARNIIITASPKGTYKLRFECNTTPDDNVIAITNRNGSWWPQPGSPQKVAEREWEFEIRYGSFGTQEVHIVTVSDAGSVLIDYFWQTAGQTERRRSRLSEKLGDAEARLLDGDMSGIPMGHLPKGLRSEGFVITEIVPVKG
jgi:pyrimidine deaminase RibD-like protein